ncbi:MAG: hypothetical protein ACYTFI_00935, partial [Planctomycetota bacterium]
KAGAVLSAAGLIVFALVLFLWRRGDPGVSPELESVLRHLEPFNAPRRELTPEDLGEATISGVDAFGTVFAARPTPDGTYSLRLEGCSREKDRDEYWIVTYRVERPYAEQVRRCLAEAPVATFPPYGPDAPVAFFLDLADGSRIEFAGSRESEPVSSTPLGKVVTLLARTLIDQPGGEAWAMAEAGEDASSFEPRADRPYAAQYDVRSICEGDVTREGLAEEIQEKIEPDSWHPELGTSMQDRNGMLVIVASQPVHERIRAFFEKRGLKEDELNPIPAEHFLHTRYEKIVEPAGTPAPDKIELARPAELTAGSIRELPGARIHFSILRRDEFDAATARVVRETGLPHLAACMVERMIRAIVPECPGGPIRGREQDIDALNRLARRWHRHSPWSANVILPRD